MKHTTFLELMDEMSIARHKDIQHVYSHDNQRVLAHWTCKDITEIDSGEIYHVVLYEHNGICHRDREIIAWLKATCLVNNTKIIGGT